MARLAVKGEEEAESKLVFSGWERTSSNQIKMCTLTSCISQTFPGKIQGRGGHLH